MIRSCKARQRVATMRAGLGCQRSRHFSRIACPTAAMLKPKMALTIQETEEKIEKVANSLLSKGVKKSNPKKKKKNREATENARLRKLIYESIKNI